MIIVAVIFLIALGALFILLPVIKGDSVDFNVSASAKKKSELLEHWQDKRESLKLSLRDLDLEHKIGKIDANDFQVLKAELLDEWALAEDELKKLEEAK